MSFLQGPLIALLLLFIAISVGRGINAERYKECTKPAFRLCDNSMPGWPRCWCETESN